MNLDGEWRVAFIQNEHPNLQYGTAPFPVDDAHPELYGSGYINGTIIGIPRGGKHQDEAWAFVKYVTTNTHFLAQFSNLIRNVPTTTASLTSPEIKPDTHFSTFLKIFGNPLSGTSPIMASGNAFTNLVQNFFTKWQAGGVKNLCVRPDESRQAARRPGRPGGRRGRRGAVSLAPLASAGETSVSPAMPDVLRAGRRKAEWRRRRLVLLLMSPWILGFSVFFGYPLVMSVYLSFNHYDLLSPPRWVGLANYRYLFTIDPQVGTAVRNTLWIIAFMVPVQVLFAFGIALMVARARRGIGFFRTVFYLPALAPPVAATLGFVYILNPSTGPVNTVLGHFGIQGPLWFNSTSWAKPSLVMLARLGRRQHDGDLSRGDHRRASAAATSRRNSTAPGRSSVFVG